MKEQFILDLIKMFAGMTGIAAFFITVISRANAKRNKRFDAIEKKIEAVEEKTNSIPLIIQRLDSFEDRNAEERKEVKEQLQKLMDFFIRRPTR